MIDTDKGIRLNVDLIAYLYLYAPILIFVLVWIKAVFAVPLIAVLTIALYLQLKDGSLMFTIRKNDVAIMTLVVALVVLWLVMSGMGNFTYQTSDYDKHNYIIDQLTDNGWPVEIDYKCRTGMLTYYIGSYIIPSVAGKMFASHTVSRITSLLYAVPGTVLMFVYLYKYLKLNSRKMLLLLILCFVFFDTFINPVKDLFMMIIGDDSLAGIQSFSKNYSLTFQCNTRSLMYSAMQIIPVWLSSSMLVSNMDKKNKWGLIVLPLLYYSLFAFVGAVIFCMVYIAAELLTKIRMKLLSFGNIASVLFAIPMTAYYAGSVFQDIPDDARMGFVVIEHWKEPLGLIMFTLSWMIWVFISFRKGNKKQLIISSVVLFMISLFSVGQVNDLAVKGCAIPLGFVFVNVFETVAKLKNKIYAFVIVILIIFCGLPSFVVVVGNLSDGFGFDKGYQVSQSLEEFEERNGVRVLFQYYDWESNPLKDAFFK